MSSTSDSETLIWGNTDSVLFVKIWNYSRHQLSFDLRNQIYYLQYVKVEYSQMYSFLHEPPHYLPEYLTWTASVMVWFKHILYQHFHKYIKHITHFIGLERKQSACLVSWFEIILSILFKYNFLLHIFFILYILFLYRLSDTNDQHVFLILKNVSLVGNANEYYYTAFLK